MQTLDTPYEIGFHLVVLLDRWYPSFLTKGKLWLLESLLVYDATPDAMRNVSDAFLMSTILNRRQLVDSALRLLIRKGIVVAKPTEIGILYRLGGNASDILSSLDRNYIERFKEAVERIHGEFNSCSVHDLFHALRQRVLSARASLRIPLFQQED